MRVVTLPPSLEERSLESVLQAIAGPATEPVLFDGRVLKWVDPYGMLGLLAASEVVARRGARPRLQLPEAGEVNSYLARMGFFEHAADHLDAGAAGTTRRRGASSDVLLEVTPVRSHGDVHAVVDRVQERAGRILATQLHYPRSAVVQFSVILSEVCQNIIEHAESGGWVAAQTYRWSKRLGRKVVVIAVTDLGRGFRASLASEHGARFGTGWDDVRALEGAFLQGLTRFHDPGRGHGLRQIRRQVARFGGKVSIRSGTARIADVPDWDDAPTLEKDLAPFPGAQIGIVLPALVESEEPVAAEAKG